MLLTTWDFFFNKKKQPSKWILTEIPLGQSKEGWRKLLYNNCKTCNLTSTSNQGKSPITSNFKQQSYYPQCFFETHITCSHKRGSNHLQRSCVEANGISV